MAYRRIVCTTDFSEASDRAVEEAASLAKALGAELTVLHVSPPTTPPPTGLFPSEEQVAKAHAAVREKLEKDLDAVRDRHGLGPETTLAHRDDPSPVEGILKYIEDNDVDLVVIATAGRSGLQRWLIGSVTERVVRHAKCAVLTVKVG
ncbi:MAG: universal stress protein [Deltaproteobacteria bacterium]|nr:universal stress protein [Deltaproteobacteria bacterium]